MYTSRAVAPLTINTKPHAETKSGVFAAAATFRYDESAVQRRRSSVTRPSSRQVSQGTSSPRRQRTNIQNPSMNGYQQAQPPAMFVRALYDYEADDRTSLSFRQGDIIQVITQLESGWWDGIHSGIRGWFPSNYCAVIASPGEGDQSDQGGPGGDDTESGTDDDNDDEFRSTAIPEQGSNSARQPLSPDGEQEEAAFWIPQATTDGRLFYYNTLTGVSRMEMPLDPPTSIDETGPRDRMNIHAPNQTRPPPEMMAGGFERDEDETSASEAEEMLRSRGSLPRRNRRSYISDGVSPAASMESLNASPVSQARNHSKDFFRPAQPTGPMSAAGATVPSFAGNLLGQYSSSTIPRSFFDDGSSPPVTWNRLVDNMRKSVESYRQAISNADRAEYVRRAEDISDHLRMLLAAGSGTTDNHSGNPSVISTNKALYPHFRDMMSRFSKLVLSSHIAATDWPAPDSYAKCLQEAEGVLHGVYGYVEIAKAQRGEEIPRLVPGFVLGSHVGGNWQNNNIGARDPMASTSFMDQDEYEPVSEPSAKLDTHLLERLDDLKRMIVSSIRRLDEQLVVSDKIVTPTRHEQISNSTCAAARKVIDYLRPYITTLESVNLAQFGSWSQNSQVEDFAGQKQRLYDLAGSLVVVCQTIAGPLSDEWSEIRGEPLETRVQDVRNTTKQLETSVSQVGFTLQGLLSSVPAGQNSQVASGAGRRLNEANGTGYNGHMKTPSVPGRSRPPLDTGGPSQSFTEGMEPAMKAHQYGAPDKIKKFFGEMPPPTNVITEEVPPFLRLEHEAQIAYDKKVDPPQLRGGTLPALVEQLTRHDRLDAPFNNTFLLTYRSFTTASELFEMLVKRFTIQPPAAISRDDYQTWVDKKQKPIRFRVVNILKSWFDSYWMEENNAANQELLRRVYTFAKESVVTSGTPGSSPLIAVVEQRLKGQDPTSKRMVLNANTQAPPPIVPKNMKKLKFLDIDPTEFARQLTIIESRLYGRIKPTECLSKTWQKRVGESEPDPAPNVKALILHSNQLTNWVAEMILTQTDVKKRVVVIKHFVSVADVGVPSLNMSID